MMWSGVEVQWFLAYALMLDEMVGHRLSGSPHLSGDVYVHETRERTLADRRARGEIEIDEHTRPWKLHSSQQALLK